MPSNLYLLAVGLLTERERASLDELGVWLENYVGLEEPTDGGRVLENLRAEAHLVGNNPFGEPAELAAFLGCCIERLGALDPAERHQPYKTACAEFAGRGLEVPRAHLPDRLLRYSTSVRRLQRLAAEQLSDEARFEVLDEPEAVVGLLRTSWDASRVRKTMLGRASTVFATFEHMHSPPLDRDDVIAVTRALALRVSERLANGEGILVEFSYPTDSVQGPRFPTIADVAWYALFQPAQERPPSEEDPRTWWGWTRPLGPFPPQPEIVHDNAPFSVVDAGPRWVGRIPVE